MKTKTSILTLALAAFGFAFAVPQASATPKSKVPGERYHDHRVDPTGHPVSQGQKKGSKKSHWQRKIGI